MAQRLDESAPAQTTAREQIRQFAPRLIVLALMVITSGAGMNWWPLPVSPFEWLPGPV